MKNEQPLFLHIVVNWRLQKSLQTAGMTVNKRI